MSERAGQTFWDHLEELRGTIWRVVLVLLGLTVAMFCLKDLLFELILAPSRSDFLLFRGIDAIGSRLGIDGMRTDEFRAQLINTQLTGQFVAHLQVSFYAAIVVGVPYIIWETFRFVAPGLYVGERRSLIRVLSWGTGLFFVGILLNYLLIFPLSCRFLFLYSVDQSVTNLIDLSSYLDTFLLLTILMGLMFELPLVCVMLARAGIINRKLMQTYRRHAIIVIVSVAAVLTPTTDVFTLMLVALPVYILYEASAAIIRSHEKSERK